MKKKNLIIDADFLIFEVTEGSYTQDNLFYDETSKEENKVKLKEFKVRFKELVSDIEEEVALAYFGKFKLGKTKIAFSDPKTNFRYDLYPDYKGNRKKSDRSDLFYKFRKWAHKQYGSAKNIEADDMYGYYVGVKGWVGASFDKDCLKGIAGCHFDVYHSRRHAVETSIDEAQRFNYLQTLMGDPTDDIKGIPRVGEKTAIKLLDEFGWSWDGAIQAYTSKGLSQDDMELNARMVLLNQWTPKKGVKLFKYKKKD